MTQRLSVLALFLTVTLIPAAAQASPVLFDFEAEAPSEDLTTLTLNSGGVTMTITREGIGTFGVQQPFGFPPFLGLTF